MRRLISSLALACAFPIRAAIAQSDSTWRDHDRAARDARLRGDWRGSHDHLTRMDALLGGHPAVVLGIARASAQLLDTAAAFAALARVARMGIFADVAADSQLAPIRGHHEWPRLVARFQDNLRPAGVMTIAATLEPNDFVAEGIAYDPGRRGLLVASIRYGRVITVDRRGTSAELIDLARDGAWGGLAVAVDARRNRLWVTSERMPQVARSSAADSGRSAILRYDLTSGVRQRTYELSRTPPHEPGDVAVASNGDLFVSDGRGGMLFVIRDGRSTLDTLVPPGHFISPQGIAPDPDGRRLFVADYTRGIAAVDRASGAVQWLPRPEDVAANGIDGMILHGHWLIGVQNGVVPDRIVGLELNDARSAIVGSRVLARDTARIRAPTHLTVVGDTLYFIANGGYDAFQPDGRLRDGATQRAPAIGRLIPPPRAR